MLEAREVSDAAFATFGQPSRLAGGIMFCLFLLYVISTSMVQYIYCYVVATLAIVEEPTPSVLIHTTPVDDNDPDAPLPPYTDKEEDAKEPLVRQEVLLMKHKPITASIRGTVRHLRSRGARSFRGLGIVLLYSFLSQLIIHPFMFFFAPSTGLILGSLVAQVALTRIGMLWTHIVISEPSKKKWYQRIVPRSVAKKAYLPTFLVGLSIVAVAIVPGVLFHVLGLTSDLRTPPTELTTSQRLIVAAKALTVCLSVFAYLLFVCIPMGIALTRCYAALLPADETPIVPMDRTFGGLFVSEADGGKGRLTLKDAWRSFDWNGRVRLVKIYAKTMGMMIVMTFAFSALSFGIVTLF